MCSICLVSVLLALGSGGSSFGLRNLFAESHEESLVDSLEPDLDIHFGSMVDNNTRRSDDGSRDLRAAGAFTGPRELIRCGLAVSGLARGLAGATGAPLSDLLLASALITCAACLLDTSLSLSFVFC